MAAYRLREKGSMVLQNIIAKNINEFKIKKLSERLMYSYRITGLKTPL